MNTQVDGFLRKAKKWQDELKALRAIVLDRQLTEEVKWRVPCYTSQNRNIVFLCGFKECCTLSFVKGALLKDAERILVKPGENSQVTRVIRFTNVREINKLESTLKAYIDEAIEVEKSGLKVKLKGPADFIIPAELQHQLNEVPALKTAFAALTPGRQRGYLLHFSSAKQSKTRAARVERCMQQILDGKGIND